MSSQSFEGSIIFPDSVLFDGSMNVKINSVPSTGAVTITAAQSGQIFFLPTNTGASVVSLPALAVGLNYKFMASGVGAAAGYAITSTGANMFTEIIANIPAGTTSAHAVGRTTLTTGAAANLLAGDYATFVCDGTNWYVTALSSGAAAGWVAA